MQYRTPARLMVLLLCLVLTASLYAQAFKTIGYLPYYRFSLIDQIELEKLTHLNLAFANPDMEGNLSLGGQDIQPVVTKAHNAGIEVFLSLAGGALTPAWAAAWAELIQPAQRSAFIHKIMDYTLSYDLQGIDVDLEWSHVDENYSDFVLELRDSVDQYDLQLTAALPGTYRFPTITDEALAAYDWINMMVYDLTGGWAPDMPGPHSPYSFAVSSIQYWTGQGVSKDRLSMGVPCYGYDFSNPAQTVSRTYATIVSMNPANAQTDQTGSIYYNGMPTIQAKTELALAEGLIGVMIWELGQDSYDEYSLLNVIWETIQNSPTSSQDITTDQWQVYPNPFETQLQINTLAGGHLSLRDMDGRLVWTQKLADATDLSISTSGLPRGMYVLSLISEAQSYTQRVIKN